MLQKPLPQIQRQIPAPVRADARLLTSLTAFGPWRQSMTLEVVHRHEKLAPESGVGCRSIAPISGACVTGLRPVHWVAVSRQWGREDHDRLTDESQMSAVHSRTTHWYQHHLRTDDWPCQQLDQYLKRFKCTSHKQFTNTLIILTAHANLSAVHNCWLAIISPQMIHHIITVFEQQLFKKWNSKTEVSNMEKSP